MIQPLSGKFLVTGEATETTQPVCPVDRIDFEGNTGKMIQVVEISPLLAMKELQAKVLPYKGSHSTTVHCSISFQKSYGKELVIKTTNQFLETLAQHIGCKAAGLQVAGVLIGEYIHSPDALFHAHLIVKSPKARKTGKTVARIQEHHDSIQEQMHGGAFNSFQLIPIYGLDGLLDYITGVKNCMMRGNTSFLVESSRKIKETSNTAGAFIPSHRANQSTFPAWAVIREVDSRIDESAPLPINNQ